MTLVEKIQKMIFEAIPLQDLNKPFQKDKLILYIKFNQKNEE